MNLLTSSEDFNNSTWESPLKEGDRVQLINSEFSKTNFKDNRDFYILEVLDAEKYHFNIVVGKGDWVEFYNKESLLRC